MPLKPLRLCNKTGCTALTREGCCEAHKPAQLSERQRATAHERGYTYRWTKARRKYLTAHPWCAACARQGKAEPATELDHIRPHRGDQRLFWDVSNWQGLCKPCHSAKTARDDGGFGHIRPSPHP